MKCNTGYRRGAAGRACAWRSEETRKRLNGFERARLQPLRALGPATRFTRPDRWGDYLPKVAIIVSRIAASRNANTKYVATRLGELSSWVSGIVPRRG